MVTACSVATVGVVCYALAVNIPYFALLGPILGPYALVSVPVITTAWRTRGRVLEAADPGSQQAASRGFWGVFYPYAAGSMMLLPLVGGVTLVGNALGLDPMMAMPLFALAFGGFMLLAARWRKSWLTAK